LKQYYQDPDGHLRLARMDGYYYSDAPWYRQTIQFPKTNISKANTPKNNTSKPDEPKVDASKTDSQDNDNSKTADSKTENRAAAEEPDEIPTRP
jgi:hypothetical protein